MTRQTPPSPLLAQGDYVARLADRENRGAGADDLDRVQALRYRAFVDPAGDGRDTDSFDAGFEHVMITRGGHLVSTFRYRLFSTTAETRAGYAAQFYDLAPLESLSGPALEVGRFCTAPGVSDPNLTRFAWAAMTRIVDEAEVALLMGCSSFAGVDATPYRDAFALLRLRHLAPASLRVGRKAPETVDFPDLSPDLRAAQRALAPLLRTYLMMGGWVSDHAVVDRALGTLHVFTGVEIAKVPENRARALRSLAGD